MAKMVRIKIAKISTFGIRHFRGSTSEWLSQFGTCIKMLTRVWIVFIELQVGCHDDQIGLYLIPEKKNRNAKGSPLALALSDMLPKAKKRKTTSKKETSPVHTQKELVEWGEKADASNLERGLLSLPVELSTEILDYFPAIRPYTEVYDFHHLLPEIYLVRIDILRALSQVCIDYRRVFLPLLWESLNVCFMREENPESKGAFYKYVGDALVRKCDGLSVNPNLASYIG